MTIVRETPQSCDLIFMIQDWTSANDFYDFWQAISKNVRGHVLWIWKRDNHQ